MTKPRKLFCLLCALRALTASAQCRYCLIIIRFSIPVLSLSAYVYTPSGRERVFCSRSRAPRRHLLARVGENSSNRGGRSESLHITLIDKIIFCVELLQNEMIALAEFVFCPDLFAVVQTVGL